MGKGFPFWRFKGSCKPSVSADFLPEAEVRGLKAPPRNKPAPAAFTRFATSVICASLSTEQGPAINASFLPPISSFPTRTMLFSGWNFRFAFLNGSETRITLSTFGFSCKALISTSSVLPTTPKTVHSTPLLTCTSICMFSSSCTVCFMFSSVASGFIITIIVIASFGFG